VPKVYQPHLVVCRWRPASVGLSLISANGSFTPIDHSFGSVDRTFQVVLPRRRAVSRCLRRSSIHLGSGNLSTGSVTLRFTSFSRRVESVNLLFTLSMAVSGLSISDWSMSNTVSGLSVSDPSVSIFVSGLSIADSSLSVASPGPRGEACRDASVTLGRSMDGSALSAEASEGEAGGFTRGGGFSGAPAPFRPPEGAAS
jgi:hypothetical protein